MKNAVIVTAIAVVVIAVCSGQQSAYNMYYEETISLVEELKTITPEAQAELNELIPTVSCQQRGSNAKDAQYIIQCLDVLAPKALSVIPKYYAYPKLLLLLDFSGAAAVKNRLILSQGIGTTAEIDITYKVFTELFRDAVAELRSTNGTTLDKLYNSVNYFKNLCEKEICHNSHCNCNERYIN